MRRNLVVDDERQVRLAIGTWLKRRGFRVATADGGASGLAALDDATFDLMIVDIFMPNMRGFESIRLFHQRAPTVPLIAISGYAFTGPETDNLACLKMALGLGVLQRLRPLQARCVNSRAKRHRRTIREKGFCGLSDHGRCCWRFDAWAAVMADGGCRTWAQPERGGMPLVPEPRSE